MVILLEDGRGNRIQLGIESLFTDGAGLLHVKVAGDLEQIGQELAQLPVASSPSTAATATKETAAAQAEPIKAHCMGTPFEPDPRTVKCFWCPHSAFDHSDAGCLKRGVPEKEFRTPGVMGYCNCGLTYAHIMRNARKEGR